MPIDPIAQKMLDDAKASGRPNAHLLPVETARQNFEDTFGALAKPPIHRVVDITIPTRDGQTIPGRLYLPAEESCGTAADGVLPRRWLAARQHRLARRGNPHAGQCLWQRGAVGRIPPWTRSPASRPRSTTRSTLWSSPPVPPRAWTSTPPISPSRVTAQAATWPPRSPCMHATPAPSTCATSC